MPGANQQVGGDVAVVGAGLIGLAIAFELAGRGASVRVYDRGEPGAAASWAGAGMLAPYSEAVEDEALLRLCVDSLARYPQFVHAVTEASGVDPRMKLDGVMHAAFDDAHVARLARRAGELTARGVICALLDRSGVLASEPWLGSNVRGALLFSSEGQVDNRRLGRALTAACRARGVSIARSESVRVECDARRVLGVQTDRGFTPAVAIVNAAGAWAGSVSGVPASCLPPVHPVKGQMLALETPIGFVRRVTNVPGAYLVPRDDGRVLIGATVEAAGFDTRLTANGVHGLLHAALSAAPALGDFTVSETWAGLRPGSPDGRPFIGATAIEGLFVATGHYRNGILLAPATAHAIAECMLGTEPADPAFSLARLETEGVTATRMSPP